MMNDALVLQFCTENDASYFPKHSLKCQCCKKSFEDELKSIKIKNSSGAVSYENIRIFIGSLRWHADALV
jgi:hypothetical protein